MQQPLSGHSLASWPTSAQAQHAWWLRASKGLCVYMYISIYIYMYVYIRIYVYMDMHHEKRHTRYQTLSDYFTKVPHTSTYGISIKEGRTMLQRSWLKKTWFTQPLNQYQLIAQTKRSQLKSVEVWISLYKMPPGQRFTCCFSWPK